MFFRNGGVCVCVLPEDTEDGGAGDESDEGETVTQGIQSLHHHVEHQLHTHTHIHTFCIDVSSNPVNLLLCVWCDGQKQRLPKRLPKQTDRKSTRLNSSHL